MLFKTLAYLLTTVALSGGVALGAPATGTAETPTRKPNSVTVDFPKALERARAMIGFQQRETTGKRLVESDIVEHLLDHPADASVSDRELYSLLAKSKRDIDPRKHLRLIPPKGEPGYQDFKIHFNHARANRRTADLRQIWIDFLSSAKKEIVLNVYEFDLMEVAQVLVSQAAKKVSVQVGIDKKRIERNPGVGKVVEFLRAGNVKVVPVETSYLNHQKTAAIDWSDPKTARVLFSSGNLTQSCLGPEGDLKAYDKRPAFSIPNANHVITMRSWLTAQLVHHELSKTFDPVLRLKGSGYPTVGSYQITGPGVPADTLEAHPSPSFIVTFTPGGGYRAVSKNLLVDLIERTTGPVRMIHFSFSSKNLSTALLARAQKEIASTGKYDFLLVGDTSSAMQKWSVPLMMSGYKRLPKEKRGSQEPANFDFDYGSVWLTTLGEKAHGDLKTRLRAAPPFYSVRSWTPPGEKEKLSVNAKIHHKILTSADYAVVGSSFNFSERAEVNHEQILIFRDKSIVAEIEAAVQGLATESSRSIADEVERRMQFYTKWKTKQDAKSEEDDPDDGDAEGEANPNSKSSI